jgi:uncharacterized repeat protein (TIGR03803 family)
MASGHSGVFSTSVLAVALVMAALPATAQVERVIHSFSGRDGCTPADGLIMDASGNFYGTAYSCGAYGYGSAFELTPESGGGLRFELLHSFGKGSDGADPYAGLVLDSAGNLYGATINGGAYGYGTVYELSPSETGTWTEKVLHDFNLSSENGTEAVPWGGLTLDSSGNLYGTASVGGIGGGAVFELTPGKGGTWTESVLYKFLQSEGDGTDPFGSLVFDSQGNLYGTTALGGSNYNCIHHEYGCGTVFELTPSASGGWSEKILHDFDNNGVDGNTPYATLIFDAAGKLYGTTAYGGVNVCTNGSYGCGTVFRLSPNSDGTWTETVLHSFGSSGVDGNYPISNLTLDSTGHLYGTTAGGGTNSGGTVFELVHKSGQWIEKILYSFSFGANAQDGYAPYAGLVEGNNGNLYGTTFSGGAYGGNYVGGTIFEIKP